MRGVGAFLIIGFVGLIVIGVWNVRQWLPLPGTRALSSVPTATSKTAEVVSGKTEPKGTRARDKRALDRGTVTLDKADQESAISDIARADLPTPKVDAPVLKTDVLESAPMFPTRKDLPAGATGVQIRAQFGEPTARVIEVHNGRVFEQYYYLDREHSQLTVATLNAGVIVSTESTLPLNNDVTSAGVTVIP
jgi:hypothetical protein